jgi:hypothetical protein
MVLPFTAPFQTCDALRTTVAGALGSDSLSDSDVAPVASKASHLGIAPSASFGVSLDAPIAPVTLLLPLANAIHPDSNQPAVLRV